MQASCSRPRGSSLLAGPRAGKGVSGEASAMNRNQGTGGRGCGRGKTGTGPGTPSRPERPGYHLSADIVAELRSTARPGKGEILVKVLSQAAAAFADED